MGKYKRLLSNTAILAVGTFASKVLVFLMMPLYTSILATDEFSVADLITQTANLLIPLACVGIVDGIFRFALDEEKDRKKTFSSGLAVLLLALTSRVSQFSPASCSSLLPSTSLRLSAAASAGSSNAAIIRAASADLSKQEIQDMKRVFGRLT